MPKHFIRWLLLAVIFVMGCALAYASYSYYNPRVDFQEYAPTKLPSGMSIGTKTVEFWSSPMLPLWPSKMNVRVSLGGHASLLEEKLTSSLSPNECSEVINQKCLVDKTSNGQTYRVVSTYAQSNPTLDDKPTDTVVTFDKNNTRILISLDQTAAQTSINWGEFIGSFTPTTFNDLQVKHMQPGP